MPNDREVWRKLSRGDAEAFEGLYREHAPALRSFLRIYLGSAQAAEDVAQETFLRLWRHPNGFDPSRSNLKAYVFGIARKCGADWWRRRASESLPPPERATPVEGSRVFLRDALEHVEPDLRSLLWLREVEGYSYDELAETFEIPLGTVRSRLFRAREQLRRIWRSPK